MNDSIVVSVISAVQTSGYEAYRYFGTIPVMYDRRPTDCYNRLDEFSNYNMNHIIWLK